MLSIITWPTERVITNKEWAQKLDQNAKMHGIEQQKQDQLTSN